MFDFENKPIQDWTLTECKNYCNNRRNKHNIYCFDNQCILRTYNICGYEPRRFKVTSSLLQFTPDEIAFCRLIKNTYPWANFIARSESYLFFTEQKPIFTNGSLSINNAGLYNTINQNFFPQIEPLTYYAIDDIIKQGENNEKN